MCAAVLSGGTAGRAAAAAASSGGPSSAQRLSSVFSLSYFLSLSLISLCAPREAAPGALGSSGMTASCAVIDAGGTFRESQAG